MPGHVKAVYVRYQICAMTIGHALIHSVLADRKEVLQSIHRMTMTYEQI